MKQVKCKSGLTGWQCRLQKNYTDFEDFQRHDDLWNLAGRLGFKSAEEAWKKNPTVQGSTNPSDFRVVKDNSWRMIGGKEFKLHKATGEMITARREARELTDKGYIVKFVSRGRNTTGCYVYKRKKAKK